MPPKRKRRRTKRESSPERSRIESLSHDGRGIARVDGKTVFVEGALPGEDVIFVRYRRRGSFDEGRMTQCLEASPDRVDPRCPSFGICGGCSLQHMAHEAQIRVKEQAMLENLKHFGRVEPEEILPPLTGPVWGYRRSARLGVRYVRKKGMVLVGFRERNSSFIADMEHCDILDSSVGGLLMELRALVGGMNAFMAVPQIEVSVGDEAGALIFRHLQPLEPEEEEMLGAFSEKCGLKVYLQSGGPDTVRPLCGEWGETLVYRVDHGRCGIFFRPGDFIQVNGGLNRQMVLQAMRMLDPGPGEHVLDLFCGLGNFSLPAARRAETLTGVEGSASMVDRALKNAWVNGVDNAVFYTSDLNADFQSASWSDRRYHKILLDPPRSGALEIVRQMPVFRAARIVYVSCNPATLARDAGELVHNGGYRFTYAGIMDMFPHTAHVEAMAVFDR